MDLNGIRFNCWANEYGDLVNLAANLPKGTIGKLENRGLGISSAMGSRSGCRIYPLRGRIDLEMINIPEGAKTERREIDGVDTLILVYEDGVYFIHGRRDREY